MPDTSAIPNGDYTEREVSHVTGAGYDSARTADIGWNGPSTSRFHLKIVSIGDHASVNMLAAHLGGALLLKRALSRHRRNPDAGPKGHREHARHPVASE